MEYTILSTEIELSDELEGVVSLFEKHNFVGGVKEVKYYTLNDKGVKRFWEATKDPEALTEDERHRILDYCLGKGGYDSNEIVNYHDLFLQSEFIKEIK